MLPQFDVVKIPVKHFPLGIDSVRETVLDKHRLRRLLLLFFFLFENERSLLFRCLRTVFFINHLVNGLRVQVCHASCVLLDLLLRLVDSLGLRWRLLMMPRRLRTRPHAALMRAHGNARQIATLPAVQYLTRPEWPWRRFVHDVVGISRVEIERRNGVAIRASEADASVVGIARRQLTVRHHVLLIICDIFHLIVLVQLNLTG